MTAAIQVEHVGKSYGDSVVLHDVSVEIGEGEFFTLLGPSGSGKSTLLRIIAGLLDADGGDVVIGGRSMTGRPAHTRELGVVFQSLALFPHLSVRKNIMFGLHDKTKQERLRRVDEISHLLGLAHLLDRNVTGLSGGEQQRVALARALAPQPRVLLLDEPLSALDPRNRRAVRRELTDLHQKLGTTTIHVTHDFEEALVVADRLAVMNKGEIVQVGPAEDVVRKPNSAFVADFFGVENVFKGEIVRCDQSESSGTEVHNAIFKSEGLQLSVLGVSEGPAYAAIRPEDIIVSRELGHSSAMNNLSGNIVEIETTGPLVRLTADVGVRLVAIITMQSLVSLKLDKDVQAYFSVKASAIHIF